VVSPDRLQKRVLGGIPPGDLIDLDEIGAWVERLDLTPQWEAARSFDPER
jgi:hypothetical protein